MFQRYQSKSQSDFRNDIPKYSDEQIIDILKKRDHYQPEAAKLAIEEAIKREIIHSEQDLFSEEFRVEELNRSMFPKIEDDSLRNRIRKSIARSLVISGLIPTVYGLVQFNAGQKLSGAHLILFGLLWIFISAQLIKAYKKVFVLILLVGLIVAVGFVSAQLILSANSKFMDFFISAVLFLLVGYGVVFLKKVS
ncbi:hypothetical protein [uncultured Draconibacterium sp.]|uniref:hypothetical protein n=1 Tax=uncultured Draconibacterium sp. TaxID=1573823 RepID=UPI003216724A